MKKEKFHIEYVFDKASRNTLWNYIATSMGLSEWFADEVNDNDKLFTFIWDGHPSEAEVIAMNPTNLIRFHWLDDENPMSYFEFRLQKIELTGGLMLEITDFAEEGEEKESIVLWDSQIKVLKRILGI